MNNVEIMHFSHFLATKDIQRMRIPATLHLKHQRKADIDTTRGGFELPTNSKMADIGAFRAARLCRFACRRMFGVRILIRITIMAKVNKTRNSAPAHTYKPARSH